ncbi:uncharacterized protein G2W53_044637 [Senna tora]|uniref:Uncharacterized protein n=1 Tax=Senna tora TaxID=362788 RepID=A0A834W034_9FABA|nr:uncharacterized protein G2W53_044637 [Senna tora]
MEEAINQNGDRFETEESVAKLQRNVSSDPFPKVDHEIILGDILRIDGSTSFLL